MPSIYPSGGTKTPPAPTMPEAIVCPLLSAGLSKSCSFGGESDLQTKNWKKWDKQIHFLLVGLIISETWELETQLAPSWRANLTLPSGAVKLWALSWGLSWFTIPFLCLKISESYLKPPISFSWAITHSNKPMETIVYQSKLLIGSNRPLWSSDGQRFCCRTSLVPIVSILGMWNNGLYCSYTHICILPAF